MSISGLALAILLGAGEPVQPSLPTFSVCRANLARAIADTEVGGSPAVSILLNEGGKASLKAFTVAHIGERAAIAHAGEVLVTAELRSSVGSGMILVKCASTDEAAALARRLSESPAEEPCGGR